MITEINSVLQIHSFKSACKIVVLFSEIADMKYKMFSQNAGAWAGLKKVLQEKKIHQNS